MGFSRSRCLFVCEPVIVSDRLSSLGLTDDGRNFAGTCIGMQRCALESSKLPTVGQLMTWVCRLSLTKINLRSVKHVTRVWSRRSLTSAPEGHRVFANVLSNLRTNRFKVTANVKITEQSWQ